MSRHLSSLSIHHISVALTSWSLPFKSKTAPADFRINGKMLLLAIKSLRVFKRKFGDFSTIPA